MTNKQQALKAQIIKLQDRNLIVPAAAVVEDISLAGLIVESHPKNPWVLGRIHWRGIRIPVISFELLAQGALLKHSEHTRIAVFHRTGEDSDVSFWGMLVQSVKPVETLVGKDLQTSDAPMSDVELTAATYQDEVVRIPNLSEVDHRMQVAGLIAR